MTSRDDKAQRYINLLDTARVNGNWSELPELIRKITKHAPQRHTLIATAILENEIIKYRSTGNRPRSSAEEASNPLAEPLETLKWQIVQTTDLKTAEEGIQGRTAIWWAHWVSGSDQEVFTPGSVTPYTEEEDATYSLWTKICVVKAAFIKGNIFNERGSRLEADVAFERVIPLIHLNRQAIASAPQLAYWVEQLLAEIAIMRTSQDLSDGGDTATSAFREWAQLASRGTQPPAPTFGLARSTRTRLLVWRAYFMHLSGILQMSRPNSPPHHRVDLVPELRRVETAFENEIMHTVKFPKADESNKLIEQWVETVIGNWEILCGSQWLEHDLGEGGRNSMSRNVIDILYRAATKTFHSTLIMRRLFQVHKSLTESDLAYKALDTYLELVERGRAKAAKAKVPAWDQDNDETIVLTIAEGIEGLCSFGHQKEAAKAHDLCIKLDNLLQEIDPLATLPQTETEVVNGSAHYPPSNVERLSAQSVETVHRALGIGKAHWAKWTPFNENRSSLQVEALAHLRFATSQPLSTLEKLKSTYALSLLLAETREIDPAVEAIKSVLAHHSAPETDTQSVERQLIAAWHLLALLLTSRQDFDTAEQSCVAAFEQFSSPNSLFGSGPGRSTSTKKQLEKPASDGLVDDMECDELQSIIEVRLTELALTELIEGPEHAVNSSNDLLSLYSRLFGHLGLAPEERAQPKALQPPKSSAGTVKSLRGSLFHRKKVASTSETLDEKADGTASVRTDTTRPQTQTTQAPTIRVTDEDEKPSPHKHHIFRHSRESSRQEKQRFSQSQSRNQPLPTTPKRLVRPPSRDRKPPPTNSAISSQRQSFETSKEAPPSSTGTTETAQPHLSPILSAEETPRPTTPPLLHNRNPDNETTPIAKQPLPTIPHNIASHKDAPPPHGHTTQPPEQDTRVPSMPSTQPTARFPRAAAQKHALAILVKIWLVIAKLYRRASMFDDSKEATDEAAKAALKIESLIASIESSARAFADPGWGGDGKSSDEAWADVYCERGDCALALAMARAEAGEREAQKTNFLEKITHDDQTHAHQQPIQVDSEGVRDAVDMYEQCLMYFPNHPGGIVGLSNVLLDYYERKVELGRKVDDGKAKTKLEQSQSNTLGRGVRVVGAGAGAGQRTSEPTASSPGPATNGVAENTHNYAQTTTTTQRPSLTSSKSTFTPSLTPEDDLRKTPENLNRLAARDRAYGLLSTLTKLGSGWDNSEAWFALARAHELGGEIERAKGILWWVVELEDSRPIRHWRNLGGKGYVL